MTRNIKKGTGDRAMLDAELERGLEHGLKQGMLYLVGRMLHETAIRRVRGLTDASRAYPAEVPVVAQSAFQRIELSPLWCPEDGEKLRALGYSEQSVAQYREQAGQREQERQHARDAFLKEFPRTPKGVMERKFGRVPMRLIAIPDAPAPLPLYMDGVDGVVQALNLEMPPLDMPLEHVVADAETVGKALVEGVELTLKSQLLFDFTLIGPRLLHMVLCVRG